MRPFVVMLTLVFGMHSMVTTPSAQADDFIQCEKLQPVRTLTGTITRFVGDGSLAGTPTSVVLDTGEAGPWVIRIMGEADLLEPGQQYEMTVFSATPTSGRRPVAYLHHEDRCEPDTTIRAVTSSGSTVAIPSPDGITESGTAVWRIAVIGAVLAGGSALVIRRRNRPSPRR